MGIEKTYTQPAITDYFARDQHSASATHQVHGELQVRQMQPGEREAVRQILKNWKASASTLQSQVKHTSSDYYRLYSVMNLSNKVCNKLKKRTESRVHLCVSRSESGVETIHSVAISAINPGYSEHPAASMELQWLVADPAHMSIKPNRNKPGRIRGNASIIIRHFAQECLHQRYLGIVLFSTDSAKGFYKKLGFKRKTVDFDGLSGISHKLSFRRIQQMYPELEASYAGVPK